MKQILIILLMVTSAFFLTAAGKDDEGSTIREITVFNAASTTDVINDLALLFTEETGIEVKTNPASSGTLAKQLEMGAKADVYISASTKWMTYVNDLELSRESSPFLKNSLVLIAPLSSDLNSLDISEDLDLPGLFTGRLSLGDPSHVPAGTYAKEALEYFHWYAFLQDRLLPGADVRAALSVVELEETELGIVYSSDARKTDKVKVVGEFPADSHRPVQYYCALLNDASSEGELFYQYILNSEEGASLYAKYGFTLP